MIISASRRTDIPKYYTEWFMNRIRAGFCTVPNPYNPEQVSYVSLLPEDVDVIVFWTRDPRPLMPYLTELDLMGFRYYFQFTLTAYPRVLDPFLPDQAEQIDTFRALASQIGSHKVIWRYDPIVFSNITDYDYHQSHFEHLASVLAGYTRRCVISILDLYSKTSLRLAKLRESGVLIQSTPEKDERFGWLLESLVRTAGRYDMVLQSCAEEMDLTRYGIQPGKCIDDNYIADVFGIEVSHRKDPGQRPTCGCVESKDIGAYDTCLHGCQYCYATLSQKVALQNFRAHDPKSPSLLGRPG
jgi:hypothetical protein